MPFPNSPAEMMLNETHLCLFDNPAMLNKKLQKPQETLETIKPITPVE